MTALPYEHVSHSQLGDWLRCQTQFRLKRIQKAPRIPSWWLVGGSVVHEVTEDLDKRAVEFSLHPHDLDVTLEIEELTEAKLNELTDKEVERSGVPHDQWFSAGKGKGQNYDWWKQNSPLMVSNYLQWWGDKVDKGWRFATFQQVDVAGATFDVPAIEYAFDVTLEILGEPVQLQAIPDRVVVLPNGELCVVDLKSGSSTPAEPKQQGLYASVIEMCGYDRPAYGTFMKAKTGEHTPLWPLEQYTLPYLTSQFAGYRAQLGAALESGGFIPNVGDACRICDVQGSCYATGGALSADWDPSDPNYRGAGSAPQKGTD